MIWPREDDWMIRMKVMLTDWVMQHYAVHHSWGQFHGKGPFTHSRIAPPIIPDLNLWCSGAQHHGHSLFPEDLFLQTNSVRSIEVTCEKPPSGRRCDTGGRVLPDWGHMWEASIGKMLRYRWTCLTRLRSHVRSLHREDAAIQVDGVLPDWKCSRPALGIFWLATNQTVRHLHFACSAMPAPLCARSFVPRGLHSAGTRVQWPCTCRVTPYTDTDDRRVLFLIHYPIPALIYMHFNASFNPSCIRTNGMGSISCLCNDRLITWDQPYC